MLLVSAFALIALLVLCYFMLWREDSIGSPQVEITSTGRTHRASIDAIRALPTEPAPESRSTATLPATAADSLRCRVIDAEGHPRSKVSVFLLRAQAHDVASEIAALDPETSNFVKEVATSEDGYAQFALATRERAFVMAMIEKESVDVRAWVGDSREIELRLPPPSVGAFEIEVVSDRGVPVSTYTVTLWTLKGNSLSPIATHTVESPDGRFHCSLTRAIHQRLRLRLDIRPPAEFEPKTTDFGRDELLDDKIHRIVVVEKVGGIRGVVVRPGGEPVAGANVNWAESRQGMDGAWAATDIRGIFVLSPSARREIGFIAVVADGYAPYLRPTAEVEATPQAELRIELDPGAVIEGAVTRDGAPLPGTRVIARLANSMPMRLGLGGYWSSLAEADANGHYRLEHVPQGSILIAVDARAEETRGEEIFSNTQRLEVVQARQEFDIHLVTGITIRGSLDVALPRNSGLHLQVVDAGEPSIELSSGLCLNGEKFQIETPYSRAAILRIWINPTMVYELPIPASADAIDLGKLKLSRSKFHPPK